MSIRSRLIGSLVLAVATYIYYTVVIDVLFFVFLEPRSFAALHWRLAFCCLAAFMGLFVGMLLAPMRLLRMSLILAGIAVTAFAAGQSVASPVFGALLAACITLSALKGIGMERFLDPASAGYDVLRRRAEISQVFIIVGEVIALLIGLAWCDRL